MPVERISWLIISSFVLNVSSVPGAVLSISHGFAQLFLINIMETVYIEVESINYGARLHGSSSTLNSSANVSKIICPRSAF